MPPPVLELQAIGQAYGDHRVVQDLSLSLHRGQIGCLLGESGCGKTTVLRTVAGFEPLTAGRVLLDGVEVSRPGWTLSPARRGVGMVFQDYALFPHLTVGQNVSFGLRGLDRGARGRRVDELLDLVGLAGTEARYPHELSGGQQQRVALARGLAPRPHLLLMDEPFSNLDVTLRERLSLEVREILKAAGATALFVTHNQLEAFAVADQIGVMRNGALLQWDSGYDLYHRPVDPGVARFVGEGVLLPGTVRGEGRVETGLGLLGGEGGGGFSPGIRVEVLVRPEDVIHDDASPIKAEVVRRCFRGPHLLYGLRLGDGELVQALVPSHCTHSPGERIGIRADVRHLVAFPRGEAGATAP